MILVSIYENNIKQVVRQSLFIITTIIVSVFLISGSRVKAASMGARSLRLSTSAASATSKHSYELTLITATSTGSISFEYCQESPLFDEACTSPTGLNLSSAALDTQIGEVGFGIHPSSTVNKIILTRVSSMVLPGVSTYEFSGIINPNQSNTSSFVRIATYASTDVSGPRIDEGGLAFSTTNPLNVQADIPTSLTLCTGVSVAVDCSYSDGSTIDFGDFSPSYTKTATSQFSISCNDDSGYKAYILGSNMTSGINTISSSGVQSVSTVGVSQFGINLAANTNPAVGHLPSGSGFGLINSNYDDSNLFRFISGDLIAESAVSTTFNRFTISYIVNISSNQAPGIYSTNMTVLGVASF